LRRFEYEAQARGNRSIILTSSPSMMLLHTKALPS
jgi:hypothetical protein